MTRLETKHSHRSQRIVPQPGSKDAAEVTIHRTKVRIVGDSDIGRDQRQPVKAADGILVGGRLLVAVSPMRHDD